MVIGDEVLEGQKSWEALKEMMRRLHFAKGFYKSSIE
jgi:hypothetical protein